MRIKLWPDSDMSVQKHKIGNLSALSLKPKTIEPTRAGLLWIEKSFQRFNGNVL